MDLPAEVLGARAQSPLSPFGARRRHLRRFGHSEVPFQWFVRGVDLPLVRAVPARIVQRGSNIVMDHFPVRPAHRTPDDVHDCRGHHGTLPFFIGVTSERTHVTYHITLQFRPFPWLSPLGASEFSQLVGKNIPAHTRDLAGNTATATVLSAGQRTTHGQEKRRGWGRVPRRGAEPFFRRVLSRESADVQEPGQRKRQSASHDGQEGAHPHLKQEWPHGHHGRRKE